MFKTLLNEVKKGNYELKGPIKDGLFYNIDGWVAVRMDLIAGGIRLPFLANENGCCFINVTGYQESEIDELVTILESVIETKFKKKIEKYLGGLEDEEDLECKLLGSYDYIWHYDYDDECWVRK